MKQAIIIKRRNDVGLIVPVKSFQSKDVYEGIKKGIHVDVDKIEQLTLNTDCNTFGIKEHYSSAMKIATNPETWSKYFCTIEVDYAILAE